jgi:hypothetical protein
MACELSACSLVRAGPTIVESPNTSDFGLSSMRENGELDAQPRPNDGERKQRYMQIETDHWVQHNETRCIGICEETNCCISWSII